MKKALIVLIWGLIFNACEQNTCNHSLNSEYLEIKDDFILKNSEKGAHFFTESNCHIINEWLNRKSMGDFFKNHIAIESTIVQLMDKTHINDTFIP